MISSFTWNISYVLQSWKGEYTEQGESLRNTHSATC